MLCNLNRRRFLQATAAAGLFTSQGIVSAWAAEPLKIGFVYVGPIGDYGWTQGHDLGRKAVEAHFGTRVKTTYVESVAEGPDAERVMRQLTQQGHGLIFTTSFGYMEQTLRVAKQFPQLKFEHATGYKTAANLSAYNARFYEGRAVVGHIAGTLTRTGKIGYVASMPIPEVVMGINATALAARKVRPDASVRVVWVHTWFDPAKEADAARALIDQGVDIMTQHTDSPAPLQVAESRGILGFGVASDMKAYAPRAQLSSILDLWGDYYISRVQAVLDATWKSQSIWYGFKEKMLAMAPYGAAVPEVLRQEADAIIAGTMNGSYHAFTGPIKNQKGEVVVQEGARLSDEDLLKMNWYVEGVTA
jgi:simple sugar transport system substrate-binding protein